MCILPLTWVFYLSVGFKLHDFYDANLGGELDDQKSISNYVFSCGSASASWCIKKQDLISLSTIEAKYKVVTLATQECVWLWQLIDDVSSSIHKQQSSMMATKVL